ncbi:unnamed protein product [Oppiella nova]|uniref:Uncharacterized protein n=1 Tax=Oppiella nova TaxID=334625 RepID=A0A7R9LWG2_9ACAR|nr:unnamed protein product [Oppiella nova]CAG2167625.1 unnamed protein product [Oppiella nova]
MVYPGDHGAGIFCGLIITLWSFCVNSLFSEHLLPHNNDDKQKVDPNNDKDVEENMFLNDDPGPKDDVVDVVNDLPDNWSLDSGLKDLFDGADQD